MEEHRSSYRRRVLKSGAIEFSGGSLPCLIRNISQTGAAFEVMSPLWFPDTFALVIQSEHLRRLCRIVWRKERRIGVTFINSHPS
ncbi:PilZ domain-containing protein [Bradyrhizobium sp. CB82]|uniref:PilZ domain-containing protein n=1 Tax=Bradyrhizobium sp. CB82 TaxID=3039159 RepID=UPI0024B15DF1|nr:PilZ domain-containing protein [Bradyrhizobium sp. CB82]WFU42155.1 PilZ domain-containing protein [Bradyrhizobium sp. CB82]